MGAKYIAHEGTKKELCQLQAKQLAQFSLLAKDVHTIVHFAAGAVSFSSGLSTDAAISGGLDGKESDVGHTRQTVNMFSAVLVEVSQQLRCPFVVSDAGEMEHNSLFVASEAGLSRHRCFEDTYRQSLVLGPP